MKESDFNPSCSGNNSLLQYDSGAFVCGYPCTRKGWTIRQAKSFYLFVSKVRALALLPPPVSLGRGVKRQRRSFTLSLSE